MARAATGRPGSAEELLAELDQTEFSDPQRDGLLNQLAVAASDSGPALDLLVTIIYRERFVRAEIRKILIQDTQAAEEALQETALSMVRGIGSFRGESTFRTWVSSIGRNRAIDVLRRTRQTDLLDEDQGEVERYSSVLASRADLEAALEALPEHLRHPVRLRDIEQRSYSEIATLLDIELNTVRSRLARGRARLAASFGDSVR